MQTDPSKPPSLAKLLREQTREAHRVVDDTMSCFDLADAARYAQFLSVHRQALHQVVGLSRAEDRDDFLRMVACVRADLQALGIRGEPAEPIWSSGAATPGNWGVAYVIRGSRLGAQVLRRGVGAGLPRTYLDFVPALEWVRFVQQLDAAGSVFGEAGTAQALEGAHRAFAAFKAASDQVLGLPEPGKVTEKTT